MGNEVAWLTCSPWVEGAFATLLLAWPLWPYVSALGSSRRILSAAGGLVLAPVFGALLLFNASVAKALATVRKFQPDSMLPLVVTVRGVSIRTDVPSRLSFVPELEVQNWGDGPAELNTIDGAVQLGHNRANFGPDTTLGLHVTIAPGRTIRLALFMVDLERRRIRVPTGSHEYNIVGTAKVTFPELEDSESVPFSCDGTLDNEQIRTLYASAPDGWPL
jgi:hypothetical protein